MAKTALCQHLMLVSDDSLARLMSDRGSLFKLFQLGIHPYFTPRHEPCLIRVALLDELRTTIDAEPVPITSFPGVLVFATALYGNLLVDHIATIGAIPHWHIGPAVVTVGTLIRIHFTAFPYA